MSAGDRGNSCLRGRRRVVLERSPQLPPCKRDFPDCHGPAPLHVHNPAKAGGPDALPHGAPLPGRRGPIRVPRYELRGRKGSQNAAHTCVQDTVQKLLNGTNNVVTTASEYQLYGFPKHNVGARDAKPDLIITREGQPQGSAHTFDAGITGPGQHVPRAALTTPGTLADYERRKWTKLKNAYTVSGVNAKRVHMGCVDATSPPEPSDQAWRTFSTSTSPPSSPTPSGGTDMLKRTRH